MAQIQVLGLQTGPLLHLYCRFNNKVEFLFYCAFEEGKNPGHILIGLVKCII